MNLIIRTFNTYDVRILGGSGKLCAILSCYNYNSYSGNIRFYADGVNLPPDYLIDPKIGEIKVPNQEEWIMLSMPMSRFEAIMSTVRLESPLCLQINFDKKSKTGWATEGTGHIATTEKELVGEEEGLS